MDTVVCLKILIMSHLSRACGVYVVWCRSEYCLHFPSKCVTYMKLLGKLIYHMLGTWYDLNRKFQ